MKTDVIVPDDIFQKAEDAASKLGMSRNELYSLALKEFLIRDESVTELLNDVYAEADSELDPVIEKIQSASLPLERW